MHLPFTTNIEVQKNIEAKYSRSEIRKHVLLDIDQSSEVFKKCRMLITKYLTKNYSYKSKANRITGLRHGSISTMDIVLELFIAILPIKIVSPIQSVTALIGSHLGFDNLLDGIKTASELIAICESSGAYTIYHSTSDDNDTGTLAIMGHYSLEPHTEAFINQTKYLPPMVCEPDEWTDNRNGGYMNYKASVILGRINHHDQKQALEPINILQDIAWELNDIVHFNEVPNKVLDTDKKNRQFSQLCDESTVVYQELIDNGNKFYFVWKYDKRGRSYSQGYHCNLQGTEYKKAILNFANKELIV